MNVHLVAKAGVRSQTEGASLCTNCAASGLKTTLVMCEVSRACPQVGPALLTSSRRTFPARQMICRPHEWYDVVPIICEGWATSTIMLPDGRRQILSFLLPGDMASSSLFFEPTTDRFVEAISEVSCRNFNRMEFRATVFDNPDLLEKLLQAWMMEKARADQLIVDLGRRTANERIARLVLSLMERLSARGMVRDQTFEFPLRHRHIADAVGLTPVHVGKVMGEFYRDGLIAISNRSLTILDQAGLARVANM